MDRPGGKNTAFAIGAAVLVLLFWPWSAWAYNRIYARPCRRAMRDLGLQICLGCGYRLHGLPANANCPECGEPRASPDA